jgi:hypothetical protein
LRGGGKLDKKSIKKLEEELRQIEEKLKEKLAEDKAIAEGYGISVAELYDAYWNPTGFDWKIVMSGNVVEIYEFGKRQYKARPKSEDEIQEAIRKRKETLAKREEFFKEFEAELERRFGDKNKLTKEKHGEQVKKLVQELQEKYGLARRADNARKTKKDFYRMVNANWELFNKFITLSFKKNITDIEQAHSMFVEWRKEIKRLHPEFEYIAVREFQDRGSVHYHILARLDYMNKAEFKKFTDKWRKYDAGINVLRLKVDERKEKKSDWKKEQQATIDNIGAYLTSYLKKAMEDPRLVGKKFFFTSQGLKKPVEVYGKKTDVDDKKILQQVRRKLAGAKKVADSQYETEYQGLTTYSQFNLLLPQEKKDNKKDNK